MIWKLQRCESDGHYVAATSETFGNSEDARTELAMFCSIDGRATDGTRVRAHCVARGTVGGSAEIPGERVGDSVVYSDEEVGWRYVSIRGGLISFPGSKERSAPEATTAADDDVQDAAEEEAGHSPPQAPSGDVPDEEDRW